MKNFGAIGVSHKTAPNEILAQFSLKGERLLFADKAFEKADICEFAIVSTCNRVEFYFADASQEIFEKAWSAIAEIYAENIEIFREHSKEYFKQSAVMHIFEVSCGIDSELTGETEILGQIKSAYSVYHKKGHCKLVLNKVFQNAIHVGKWIRANTQIGAGKITIGAVAAELAARIFDDVKKADILLLGSGQVGQDVAQSISVRGSGILAVASRSFENALKVCVNSGSFALPLENALQDLSRWDIIICAMALESPILLAGNLKKAIQNRKKPLFIIDLGMPKNAEALCAKIDGVYLYDLSDLSRLSNENRMYLEGEIAEAKIELQSRSESLCRRLFGYPENF
ncbi:MAG: glutamyl-tRNA reductase [Opitutales bacterium]|nr:glutamyl-tRNA reductase [Opitutales bacterium]